MIVNDVFKLFCAMVRTDIYSDIERKELAFNEGYLHLVDKCLQKNCDIEELVVIGQSIAVTINQNYVSLPSNFYALKKLYRKEGTLYRDFRPSENMTFEDLTEFVSDRFFDTTDTGDFRFFAIKKPYIYFDHHALATNATGLKINYIKNPASVSFYDSMPITNIVGSFSVGDIVSGQSSGSSAEVTAVGSDYLYIKSSTISGPFAVDEEISNLTGATADLNGAIDPKVQELELGDQYKLLLATAISSMYLFMDDDIEGQAKDASLDALIDTLNNRNANKQRKRWGYL
jgi:hypothetical protein